ncbi:MAG: hypothetical protein HYX27_26145 [Acidobacteria bacterium]|nr:hypothetical protein [Acidobacteriota bacterium]
MSRFQPPVHVLFCLGVRIAVAMRQQEPPVAGNRQFSYRNSVTGHDGRHGLVDRRHLGNITAGDWDSLPIQPDGKHGK